MGKATVLSVFFSGLLILSAYSIPVSILVIPIPAAACGMAADAICMGCQMDPKKPRYCLSITCADSCNGGTTVGICSAPGKCLGKTTSASGGPSGVGEALGLTKQIMDLLKGLGGGGGGGGGSEVPASQSPATVCPNGYYTVTQPSTDPCAVYNPNSISEALGGTTGISGSLLDALNGNTGSASPTEGGASSTSSGTTQSPASTPTNANVTGTSPTTPPVVVSTTSKSLTGDIKIGGASATVVANFKQGVTEVAGFFGGSTFGGGNGQSAASRLCASRPWAGSGLIASFVPNGFFDGMCSKAGYQVGVVQKQVTTPVQQPTSNSISTAVSTPTATTPLRVNTIPPEVDIWAEPISVRLGTRAYIFWNARGVDMCAASGPNFSQSSISGGASTVPISGATNFSIECTAPDGTKVTDSVTVNLAL